MNTRKDRVVAAEGANPEAEAQHRSRLRLTLPYVVALSIVIVAVGIYMRSGVLQYTGFFEPDGFFHYSVIEQAITNNLIVPMTSQYSGFPMHNEITEPLGLYYVTLIPYSFLQYFGVTAYAIQRLMPLIFAIAEMVVAYFIVQHLSKSRALGLIAMLMLALSGGDAARTSALVYRGDSFITLFMLLSLLFMFKAIETKEGRKKYAFMLLSPIALGIGTAVWNGSPYTIIVYMLAIILIEIYAFIRGNLNLSKDSMLLGAALIVEYGIQHLFEATKVIRLEQAFSSPHFFIFYAPMVLGGILFYYILKAKRETQIFSTVRGRSAFLAGISVVAIIVIVGAFYNYLGIIATGNGLVASGNSFTSTIQELQQPTMPYLWVSFSLELFLVPLAFILFALYSNRRAFGAIAIAILLFVGLYYLNYMTPSTLFWVDVLIGAAAFVVVVAKHSEEEHTVKNAAFVALLAYFVVTFYLQSNAVRFNALVGSPIAIMAAYALYRMGKDINGLKFKAGFLRPFYAYVIVAIIAVGIMTYVSYGQMVTEAQADGINPAFLNATAWIRNSTPTNATFLTLWPDGSVVEGWGHRQSITDSVGGQGNISVTEFPVFLFSTRPDAAYLEKVHPDYLLVRGFWFQESGGIAQEGSIQNQTDYGFVAMQPLQPEYNTTTHVNRFAFASNVYNAYMLVNATPHGNQIAAYMSYAGNQYVPVNKVLLYNNANGTYSSINVTNAGANYTLLVGYVLSRGSVEVQNAAILASKLPESNFFKLIVLCNTNACPYDNRNITLTTVYANADTKIFKVNYNAR